MFIIEAWRYRRWSPRSTRLHLRPGCDGSMFSSVIWEENGGIWKLANSTWKFLDHARIVFLKRDFWNQDFSKNLGSWGRGCGIRRLIENLSLASLFFFWGGSLTWTLGIPWSGKNGKRAWNEYFPGCSLFLGWILLWVQPTHWNYLNDNVMFIFLKGKDPP